jgi:glycosyltransferase involved in cell wall biosynthesis
VRVAAVIQSFAPVVGGAQRQLQALAPLLAAAGHELSIITRRPAGAPSWERIPGAEVHRVSPWGAPRRYSLQYTALGAATVMRSRAQVLHAHDLMSPSTIGLAASTVLRAPLVVKVLSTGVGGDVDRLLGKPAGERRLQLLSRRVDAFVCLSREIEEELGAHGVEPGRMRRIPNGVDVERFRPAAGDERARTRRSLGLGSDDRVMLYCGRFYEAKRLEVLVDAMTTTPGQLLLVGEGPARGALESRVRDLGLTERVRLLAPMDDVAPLYRAADVYVSASRSEGMSGSVLEAMASGLPVVAAQASGMADLLADRAGVVLPGGEPADFARELSALAAGLDGEAGMGERARRRAVDEFALARTASRLGELYEEVVARRRGRDRRSDS